jgi:hypothetical protein
MSDKQTELMAEKCSPILVMITTVRGVQHDWMKAKYLLKPSHITKIYQHS